jgi:hypothetical protein
MYPIFHCIMSAPCPVGIFHVDPDIGMLPAVLSNASACIQRMVCVGNTIGPRKS